MSTKVFASASVNPLSDISSKTSGMLRFALESSALDIGYTEYKNKDGRIGFTGEVNKAYRVGVATNSNVIFESLSDNTIYNPLDDFNDQAIDRMYPGDDRLELGFMPLAEILSDKNHRGVAKNRDGNPDRVRSEKLLKAMNLDPADMQRALVGSEPIPQMGTTEWNSYSKAYRASGSAKTEASYRSELIRDAGDKADTKKDITDIAVGYFGTFNEDATVMPLAMYYTFLSCLQRTESFVGSTTGTPAVGTTPSVPSSDLGKTRSFRLHSKLYSATYTMSGYMLREVTGVIKGNSKHVRGYAKTSVHLDVDEPLSAIHGITIHSDFPNQTDLYMNKTDWNNTLGTAANNAIPDSYVKIQIQINSTTYRELILVDLYQETTIEGNGKTRRSNSGNQDNTQREMTWTEAYIAESFIPLTRDSMLKVRLFDRGNLLVESKCHFMQIVNVTKEKWYQTGIFRAIMTIISVVVTVTSGGLAGGITKVLYTLAIGLVVQYALTYLVQVLVDLGIIDSTVGLILITVVAMWSMNKFMGVAMDFKSVTTILNLSEATGKVFAAQLVAETNEHKDKMAEIQKEKDRLDEEGEALAELHTPSAIGRLMTELKRLVDVVEVPLIETREEFMYRTTTRHVVTEPLTYEALKYKLMNLV